MFVFLSRLLRILRRRSNNFVPIYILPFLSFYFLVSYCTFNFVIAFFRYWKMLCDPPSVNHLCRHLWFWLAWELVSYSISIVSFNVKMISEKATIADQQTPFTVERLLLHSAGFGAEVSRTLLWTWYALWIDVSHSHMRVPTWNLKQTNCSFYIIQLYNLDRDYNEIQC